MHRRVGGDLHARQAAHAHSVSTRTGQRMAASRVVVLQAEQQGAQTCEWRDKMHMHMPAPPRAEDELFRSLLLAMAVMNCRLTSSAFLPLTFASAARAIASSACLWCAAYHWSAMLLKWLAAVKGSQRRSRHPRCPQPMHPLAMAAPHGHCKVRTVGVGQTQLLQHERVVAVDAVAVEEPHGIIALQRRGSESGASENVLACRRRGPLARCGRGRYSNAPPARAAARRLLRALLNRLNAPASRSRTAARRAAVKWLRLSPMRHSPGVWELHVIVR